MPTVTMALDQKNISLRRQAELSVINQFIDSTGFPDDAIITLNEDQGGVRSHRSNTAQCDDPVTTKHNNFIFAKTTEKFTDYGVLYNSNMEMYQKLVFNNNDVGIQLYPIYGQVETAFELELRTRDLSVMNNWILKMRAKQGLKHLLSTYDIYYDYSIPDSIALFLYETYLMTEKVDGYGRTYADYVKEYFNKRPQVRKNISGEHEQPIIVEKHNGARAFYDDYMPYDAVTTEEGQYSLTVTFRVIYNQITSLRLSFPLFIHNQTVNMKYVNAWTKPYGIVNQMGYKPGTWMFDNMSNEDFIRYYRGDGGSRMVEFDDYFPKEPRRDYLTMFLSPIQVNDNDLHKLPGLNDIPSGKLPDFVKDYVKEFQDIGFNYKDGPIIFEHYETGKEERRLQVEVSPNGDLRTKAPMVRRNQNYLCISVTKDFAWISGGVLRRLMKYPDILTKIILLIDPTCTFGKLPETKRGDVDILINQAGNVDDMSLYYWIRKTRKAGDGYLKTRYGESKRVSVSNVIAWRE